MIALSGEPVVDWAHKFKRELKQLRFKGASPLVWVAEGSGAGNARLQTLTIELAWNWIRWQPGSAITQWYRAHFGAGKRARKIGIVAVARKLLIALWRYVTTGVVPTGAIRQAM